jgi:hypothetical protein
MRISSFLSRRVLRAREDCGDGRRRAVPYCVVNVCGEAFTNCCPVSPSTSFFTRKLGVSTAPDRR